MTDRVDEKRALERFLSDIARTMSKCYPYSESARQHVIEKIRRMLPWEPHPDGGFVYPWPEHLGKGEVRWDGDLSILNTGTLHAALEHVTVSVTVGD